MPYITDKQLKDLTDFLEAQDWHQRHPGWNPAERSGGIRVPGLSDSDSDDVVSGFGAFVKCVAARRVLSNTPSWVKDAYTRALNEGSDAAGEVLVPHQFVPVLLQIIEDNGVMRKLCRVVPMTGKTADLSSLITNVQTYWPAENQTITQSDPVFGHPVLTAKTLAGITSSSAELLADSGIELGNLLLSLFGQAIALEEDRQVLAANANPFKGVLFESNVNQVTMAGTKTNFNQVDFTDVNSLIDAITTAAGRNARFFLHRTILNVLKRIRDLNHQYIWAPPTAEVPPTLWGYPYTLSDMMPSTGDTAISTNFIAFGNPQNILIGDRQQLTMAVSTEAGFKQNEVFYKVTERIAVLTAIPAAFSRLRTAAA